MTSSIVTRRAVPRPYWDASTKQTYPNPPLRRAATLIESIVRRDPRRLATASTKSEAINVAARFTLAKKFGKEVTDKLAYKR
jgi:hypothetical protein